MVTLLVRIEQEEKNRPGKIGIPFGELLSRASWGREEYSKYHILFF